MSDTKTLQEHAVKLLQLERDLQVQQRRFLRTMKFVAQALAIGTVFDSVKAVVTEMEVALGLSHNASPTAGYCRSVIVQYVGFYASNNDDWPTLSVLDKMEHSSHYQT